MQNFLAWNEKGKKKYFDIQFQKYGKSCSIFLIIFINHWNCIGYDGGYDGYLKKLGLKSYLWPNFADLK